MKSENSSQSNPRNYKVGRVIREYSLTDLDSELVSRWTGERQERSSLRDLADFFNQQVLQTAVKSEGLKPLEGEIENLYHLLTDDDVSQGLKVAARRKLAREGIDVESLEDDFVTHQAIHTYLTNYLGVKPPQNDDRSRIEKDIETLQKLQNRTKSVTENTIERLRNSGQLSINDPTVFVNVTVNCQSCDNTYNVKELLDAGHCECQ